MGGVPADDPRRWKQSPPPARPDPSPNTPPALQASPRRRVGKALHARRYNGFLCPVPRLPMSDNTTKPALPAPADVESFVADKWDREIVPQLVDYIRFPNKSTM